MKLFILNANSLYRASQVVVHLGWVYSDLGSSPGWRAATVATYCLGRVVEHPKSKSTKPRCTTTWDALYIYVTFRNCLTLSFSM